MPRRALTAVLVLLAFCLSTLPVRDASARPPARLVFFGDSLSDPGNFALLHPGQIALPPFSPLTASPYLIGGFHFSNGWTWAEQLSLKLGMPLSGGPAVLSGQLFSNYAVGSARARPQAMEADFDLNDQIQLFLEGHRGMADAANLYVIWIGANDLFDALQSLNPAALAETVAALTGEIALLHARGARMFLIVNIPDLGRTPLVRSLPPPAQAAATALTRAYNGAVHQALLALRASLAGVSFLEFDVDALLAASIADPERFGFEDVEHPCLAFGVVKNAVCARPNRHLFWDGIHPTAGAHRNIARAVLKLLRGE